MFAKKGHREFFEVFRLSHSKDKSTPEKKEFSNKTDNEKISDSDREVTRKHTLRTKAAEPKSNKNEHQKWIKKSEKIPKINISKKVPNITTDYTETLSGKIKSLRKEEVKLSQETIIIGAIAATFLSIACFFVGYKVGHNKGVLSNAESTSSIKNERAINSTKDDIADSRGSLNLFSDNDGDESGISGLKRSSDDLWTLRIISYRNTSPNLLKATNLAKAIKNMTGANAFVAKAGNELIVCVGKFKDDNDQNLIDLQIKMADLVYENKKQFKSCYPVKLR